MEAEERLARYTAALPLTHKTIVTYNHVIPNIHTLLSVPTALESTAIVAVAGPMNCACSCVRLQALCVCVCVPAGLDLMVTPVVPVIAFDKLSSTFNKPVLVLIIVGLTAAVLVISRVFNNKLLSKRWQ